MKKIKQAFTIVELVIVIAVIAVLAAVLIPTFSNIIRRANLSADRQAVREMNMALAADEAANGYGKNMNVEDAMYVLGVAGYNTDNWACLTNGYQVYWYEKDNRMILYNSGTAEIEYPEEYIGKKVKVEDASGTTKEINIMLTNLVHIYNENHIKAQQFNMSLSNAVKTDNSGNVMGTTTWIGGGSNAIESTTTINGVEAQTLGNSATNLEQLQAHSATIATALGLNSTDIYMYATKEDISADTSGAYASLQICSVGAEATLQNNGSVKENLYYLTIVDNNGTPEQLASARKAAAQYVYNIFDQITEGKIDDDVTIIIEKGVVIDCSLGGADWAPCKTFTGYFGCPDGTITIDGANLTSKTGYAQTVSFMGSQVDGTSSMYYVTGFFGTVYGNTTIENVTFKNLNISSPCIDAIKALEGKAISATKRNTVAVIGGITDGFTGPATDQEKQNAPSANVTIKNVRVDDSCSITGAGCVGGLVGYIGCGSGDNTYALKGTVNITNCYVGGTITSLDTTCGNEYGEVGGIFSFTTRCNQTYLNIVIDSCTVNAVLKGYYYIGAAMSRMQAGKVKFKGENDFSGAKFDLSNHLSNYNYNSKGSPVWAIGAASSGASINFTNLPVYTTVAAEGYYAPTEVARNAATAVGLNDTLPLGPLQ